MRTVLLALLKARQAMTWLTDQGVPYAEAGLRGVKNLLQRGRDRGWWDQGPSV